MRSERGGDTIDGERHRIWGLSTPQLVLFYASGVLLGVWVGLAVGLVAVEGRSLVSWMGMVSVLGIATAVCIGIVATSTARHRQSTEPEDHSGGRGLTARREPRSHGPG